jgi:NADPH:quinone reductase-like Zn-dependent oxidoreductase
MGAVGEAAVQIARKHGVRVSGTCGAADMARAHAFGVENVLDYRQADLSQLRQRYDAVFDTAASMDRGTGFGLLKPGGVLLDLHPTPSLLPAAAPASDWHWRASWQNAATASSFAGAAKRRCGRRKHRCRTC